MVSIVVPVYNKERYIEKCLSSIHAQTVLDWECIVIDDGSTDSSQEICRTWCKMDSRFRLIVQPNSGVSVARNVGIQIAKGDWISFVDADDWLTPDYLQNMDLDTRGDLVVSGQTQIFTNNYIEKTYVPSFSGLFILDRLHLNEFVDLNKNFLLYGPCSKLYKKQIITDNGVKFPVGCSYGEDVIFNYEYLRHIESISVVNKSNYFYRYVGGSSLSGKIRKLQFEEDYEQWHRLVSFYCEKEMWEDPAKELLYGNLWAIIYEALFAYPFLTLTHVKKVLSIPEIEELGFYTNQHPCAGWIKHLILGRHFFVMYYLLKIIK